MEDLLLIVIGLLLHGIFYPHLEALTLSLKKE